MCPRKTAGCVQLYPQIMPIHKYTSALRRHFGVLSLVLLSLAGETASAASPPPAIRIATTTDSKGGRGSVAVDPSGNIYIAIQATEDRGAVPPITTDAAIESYTPAGVLRWRYVIGPPKCGHDVVPVPTVDSENGLLWVVSEGLKGNQLLTGVGARLRALKLNPVSAAGELVRYTTFSTITQCRAQLAFDSSSVYVHANDGKLYAVPRSATSSATSVPPTKWWATGNIEPRDATCDPDPMSSGVVIGCDGMLFVGTAQNEDRDNPDFPWTGRLLAFNPAAALVDIVTLEASGPVFEVALGAPVSSPPAIGPNGWVYVASRNTDWSSIADGSHRSKIFAINPVQPSSVANYEAWMPVHPDEINGPGAILGVVIDRYGYVYAPDFGHTLTRYTPTLDLMDSVRTVGKLCQTPAITHGNFIIFGESDPTSVAPAARKLVAFPLLPIPTATVNGSWGVKIGQTKIETASDLTTTAWQVKDANVSMPVTTPPLDPFAWDKNQLGGLAIASDGVIWSVDSAGQIVKISGTSPLMGGSWTSLQGGNRRTGAFAPVSEYIIAELGGHYPGSNPYPPFQEPKAVHQMGYTVGQANGYYMYPASGGFGWIATRWVGTGAVPLGDTSMESSFALGMNSLSDIVGWKTSGLPYVWEGGLIGTPAPVALSRESGSSAVQATGVNDNLTVVGYGIFGSYNKVYRWNKTGGVWPTAPTAIPLSGNYSAQAFGITRNGRIFGKAKFAGGNWKGYYSPVSPITLDSVTQLTDFGGGQSEALAALDDYGVVGRALKTASVWRAFFIPGNLANTPGLVAGSELPRLQGVPAGNTTYSSAAYGLNRSCAVVGEASDSSGSLRAFAWGPGKTTLVNLQPFVTSGSPLVLDRAVSIADGGLIVGKGHTGDGYYTPFVYKGWIAYPVYKTN